MGGGAVRCIVAFAMLAQTCAGLVVEPSENKWVLPGDEVQMICKTTAPIHSCSWETPYGTHYPLEEGIVAEGGRLAGFSDGTTDACGVIVSTIEDKDAGDWKCHVSVVSGGEAHPGDAKVSLHLATRPDSVSVLNNLGKLREAIKEANGGRVLSPVTCVVGKADPKPAFEWFLSGEPLKNTQTQDVKNEDGSWSQILSYEPEASHHNQTLRCKVSHVGFQKGDVTEADTVLTFDEEAINFLRKGIVEQEVASYFKASMYPVVGIVVFVTIVTATVVTLHHQKKLVFTFFSANPRRQSDGSEDPAETDTTNSAEGGDVEQGGQPARRTSSWLNCCARAKKTLESTTTDEDATAADAAPEEVKAPLPEEPAKADPTEMDDGIDNPEPVVDETTKPVATEVKGRFRMFKWMKKASPKAEDVEKASAEEMGEKADEPEKDEKADMPEKGDETEKDEKADEPEKADEAEKASPKTGTKNTAV